MLLLISDGRFLVMAGPNRAIIGQVVGQELQAAHQVFHPAEQQVAAADVALEKRVSGKGLLLLLAIVDDTAGRMARGVESDEFMLTKTDNLVVLQKMLGFDNIMREALAKHFVNPRFNPVGPQFVSVMHLGQQAKLITHLVT